MYVSHHLSIQLEYILLLCRSLNMQLCLWNHHPSRTLYIYMLNVRRFDFGGNGKSGGDWKYAGYDVSVIGAGFDDMMHVSQQIVVTNVLRW